MKLLLVTLLLSLAVAINAQGDEVTIGPGSEYLPPAAGELNESAELADDGYRYKTVRKLKYRARHRRDVSQEYLPPLVEYLPPTEEEKADTKLAEDGYRYKTVNKLKYRSRHRRDVSEIEKPASDYLPPADIELAPDLRTILGDDGYQYKTVKRLKYKRHRRDVVEAVAAAPAEYLPPAADVEVTGTPADNIEVKNAELANDGYRYKTVRRIKYRTRV